MSLLTPLNPARRLPVMLLMLGAACRLAAMPHGPDSIGTAKMLGDVEVTARQSPVKVSSAMPVQTLDATRLAQLGVSDVGGAVKRFAGVSVRDYGGQGGLKTVSVHNMGATHTAVSYDGVPMDDCRGGQTDVGRLSLDNVATLSLAVGQNDDLMQPARLYGSAASLWVNTLRPTFKPGRSTAVEVRHAAGSWGYQSPMARWWQKAGDKVTASLEGSYTASHGDYPFTLVNGRETSRERRLNSAMHSWRGEANVYYTPATGHELQLKGSAYRSKRGLPGAVVLYNPVSTQCLRERDAFVQGAYRGRLPGSWRLNVLAKYSCSSDRDSETGPKYADGLYNGTHRQQEIYGSAVASWAHPGGHWSAALAQDVVSSRLEASSRDCPSPRRLTTYTALTARYGSRALTCTATATATSASHRVSVGPKPAHVSRIDPSLSLSVKPLRNEMLYVRAMAKGTYRAPSFNDLYYERVGNRTLRPERARECGAGLTWSRRLFMAMDYLTLTADGYLCDVRDKIVAYPSTYVWRTVNFGRAKVKGIDLTVATAATLPRDITVTITGAYTWQRAIDVTSPQGNTYRHMLPYTPMHSGNASLTAETPWLTVGYSLSVVGNRYFQPQNIAGNAIAPYTEHTLTAGHEFKLRHMALGLRGEVLNLTDARYEVIKFYPMPGRSWRLTAWIKI